MVGELWIDEGQVRLVKIDAHLISDVNFGWGVLGRLYEQAGAVSPPHPAAFSKRPPQGGFENN